MAMKWIRPEDKEPLFECRYLVIDTNEQWQIGYLREIKTTANGQEFVWYDGGLDEIMTTITHYMKIEPAVKPEFKL